MTSLFSHPVLYSPNLISLQPSLNSVSLFTLLLLSNTFLLLLFIYLHSSFFLRFLDPPKDEDTMVDLFWADPLPEDSRESWKTNEKRTCSVMYVGMENEERE